MSNNLTADQKLRIKGHLYEIRKVNGEVIGGEQGYPMAEMGYKKTLENVGQCSTSKAINDVADEIKRRIKQRGERPANREIRRYARKVVSKEGFPPTPYLNRA